MHRNIVLMLVLIAFSKFARAQIVDWCPSGAKWTIGYLDSGYEGFYNHQYIGDTILDGVSCKIIEETSKIYWYPNPGQYNFGGPDYWYTYEDSGRIYFRLPADTVFYLLYDFNTPVGGKWAVRDMYSGLVTDSVVVDSIGTEIINGDTLQCMWVVNDTNGCQNYITEWTGPSGVQSRGKICERTGNWGYLFPEMVCAILEYSYQLRCYEDSEIGFYSTGIADSCDQIPPLVSRDEWRWQTGMDVHPNPASSIITVKMNTAGEFEGRIISLEGKEIWAGAIEGWIEIDVKVLPEGIYVLEVCGADGKKSRQKIVVTH